MNAWIVVAPSGEDVGFLQSQGPTTLLEWLADAGLADYLSELVRHPGAALNGPATHWRRLDADVDERRKALGGRLTGIALQVSTTESGPHGER